MTKKEIVKTISEEIGLTQLKTKEIVQKTFDAIVDTLVEDRRIELRNFGVFEVKKRADPLVVSIDTVEAGGHEFRRRELSRLQLVEKILCSVS